MTSYFTRFPISYLMEDVKKKYGVNHKFYLIYHLIDRHRDKENNSWLTIKNVSDFCGIKYTKRESNCFREVLDALDFMAENQMIFIRQDIKKCTFDTCIEITINQINYDPDKKFLKLFYEDVDWIRNYRSSIKKEKLLRVYLHMLYFIGARPRDSQGNELGENPHAFPEAYFGSIDNMAKNLSMSKQTIYKCLDSLVATEDNPGGLLIKEDLTGTPLDGMPNIYVLNKEGYEQEIQWAIKKMMEMYSPT